MQRKAGEKNTSSIFAQGFRLKKFGLKHGIPKEPHTFGTGTPTRTEVFPVVYTYKHVPLKLGIIRSNTKAPNLVPKQNRNQTELVGVAQC